MSSYKQVSISIPSSKAKKLAEGKIVNITHQELMGSDDKLFLHPANHDKVMKAKKGSKGVRLQLAEGEIVYDIMQGGNIFKSLWKGLKSLWAPVIKPALSLAADNLVPIASAATGNPAIVSGVRQGLKQLTGIGVSSERCSRIGNEVASTKKMGKGTPEMKAHMAKLRAMRRGGSFRL